MNSSPEENVTWGEIRGICCL
ncbi:hypothetical protein AVEN_158362-1, partial [Araneus ventricosus]